MTLSHYEETAGAGAAPFPSLAALRQAHSHLLNQHRDSGRDPAFLGRVRELILRGRLTGAVLDTDADRMAAQTVLDYWATVLVRAGEEPPEANLRDFDPGRQPDLG